MRYKGAKILIEQLKAQGVDTIFGYPGASILALYDELYHDKSIKNILSVSEAGAVFMADGYARSSGKVGVCMATSGPGATNLVTGIAGAYMDSIPLVVICGNVPVENLGHDTFQEVDTAGITMPITKYNYIVKDIEKLASIVSEAFLLANTGRKGPVVIDIPKNIFTESCKYPNNIKLIESYKKFDNEKFEVEFESAVELINKAEHPLIYAGGGVTSSDTTKDVIHFAEKLNAPIAVSLMGLGIIPSNHQNYIGVGTSINNLAKETLKECDLFITLGARFSEKATNVYLAKYKNTKLLHIDIDRAEINKNLTADNYIVGNLKEILPRLTERINNKNDNWLKHVICIKKSIFSRDTLPKQWIGTINKFFGNEQIIATDVGQHQLWVANYYNFDKPHLFLSSCGLGSMGYGLGAAIGAYVATKKPIVLITGDGSFNMNFNELITAVKLNVPLAIFIMNNKSLGMIREFQSKFYKKHFIDSDLNTHINYVGLAKSMGAKGYKLKSPDELDTLLNQITIESPVVFDCKVNKNEKSM